MKTNAELRAALNMVLARLDAEPNTIEEWDAIRSALDDAARYAGKVRAPVVTCGGCLVGMPRGTGLHTFKDGCCLRPAS